MLSFKMWSRFRQPAPRNTALLYENGRLLVSFAEELLDGAGPGWKRFGEIINNYNIWSEAYFKRKMIVLPVAPGEMLGTTRAAYDIEVMAAEVTVTIKQNGEEKKLSLKEFEALAAKCVRRI